MTTTVARRLERAQAYEALFEIGTQIQAQEANPAVSFALIVERACKLIDSDVAWLALLTDDGARVRIANASGVSSAAFMRMEVELGTGIGGLALTEGRPVAVTDADMYDNGMPQAVHRALRGEGVRSVLCAPMLRDGSMIGALYVGTRTVREFDAEDQSLLAALAAQAAITVQNSRLYASLADKNRLLEQVFAIQRRLTEAALADVGPIQLTAEVALVVGREVVLITGSSPRQVIRCRPHDSGSIDELQEWSELPAPQATAQVTAGGTALGELWALGDEPLSRLQLRALEQGAVVVALAMMKARAALEVEWRLQGELLEEILRCEEPSETVLSRAMLTGIDLARPHCVAALEPSRGIDARELLAFVRRALQSQRIAGLAALRGERVLAALPDAPGRPAQAIATALQAKAARAGIPFSCGLSRGLCDFRAALREAEAALALARERDSTIVTYEELGPLRFVLDAPANAETQRLVRQSLEPLASRDRARGSQLMQTLEVFLMSGGHRPSICERCHIHPSTLKYRLSQITTILGVDLSDPAVRFRLSLAFELIRVLAMIGVDPFAADSGGTPSSPTRRPAW